MEQTISPWLIYWVMQADTVQTTLSILFGVLLGCAVLMWVITGMCAIDGDSQKPMKTAITISVATGALMFLAMFVPTTKTLVTMFSVPTLIQVADDVELDETTRKSNQAVNKLLDAYIDEKQTPE